MSLRSLFVYLAIFAALTTTSVRAQAVTSHDDPLRSGFTTPPASAKLRCYWWWLNGNTDEETITHDLTEMKAKGFGGVLLVDADGAGQNGNAEVPAGPLFASPAWTRLFLHALNVAQSLGLEVSLNATSGWNLGGPGVKSQDASKLLTFSRMVVHGGGASQTIKIAMPPSKNGFYREIATLAYPLRHGAADPKPIRDLESKTASRETGFSMPDSASLLTDVPATPGEQDADVKDVLDLTSLVSANGKLQWQPPVAGEWEILQVGYTDSDKRVSTASGAWQGLAIDYMDHTALDHYWDSVLAPMLTAAKPYIGTSFKYIVTDSWELGGTNWTPRFRDEFRKRRGYDPVPYLPIVAGRILDDRATSNHFLDDLRRTVADLIVVEHYDAFTAHAHMVGLGVHSESGGPHGAPIDALETFRSSSFPQTEFWGPSKEHRSTDPDRFFVKEAASAANIYGKPLVAAEGPTSIGPQWSESLGMDLKPAFDRAVTEGMNRLVWHEFTSSPKATGLPGQEYFAGTHINPKVTWWNQSASFFTYLNRVQFMMQRGHPVADLLYYYGDEVPNFVRLKADDPANVLPGYDYDVTNEDALLHHIVMLDGQLRSPNGIRYRALAMPATGFIGLASLERIANYVRSGGTVIGVRPVNAEGIGPEEEPSKFDALTKALWDSCDSSPAHHATVGKGQVFCSQNSRDALRAMSVLPDFESDAPFDYIHRRDGDTDIYFIRNSEPTLKQGVVTLRVEERQPELYFADTGDMETTLLFSATGDHRTRIPVTLPPYGSAFVVFRRPAPKRSVVAVSLDGRVLFGGTHSELPPGINITDSMLDTPLAGTYDISYSDGTSRKMTTGQPAQPIAVMGPWTIHFPTGWGAPPTAKITQLQSQLQSWTESSDSGIRYFSGTATYSTTLNLTAEQLTRTHELWLDLGDVREIATVRINGTPAETVWKQPWSVRVDTLLHTGDNIIELDVTNLWPNRIIGDARSPSERPYTATNIRKYTKDSPLLPSGLLGPVLLEPRYRLSLN